MAKKLRAISYSMIGIFLLLFCCIFLPVNEMGKSPFYLMAILGISFLVLGGVLIWMSRKEKGKLKFYMMLTGFSAISPLVFSILHNVFYGFGIAFENLAFIFEPLHVASFIISLIVAPIGFIIGIIGIFLKGKEKK